MPGMKQDLQGETAGEKKKICKKQWFEAFPSQMCLSCLKAGRVGRDALADAQPHQRDIHRS